MLIHPLYTDYAQGIYKNKIPITFLVVYDFIE
jgi:hypothetical protein